MTVTTQVSEADVSKLRLGMDAYFTTLGQPDRRWFGTLRQVLPTPEILNNVVLYNALFDVPNPTGELMTQMSAQVFFIAAAAKNVPVVPMAALRPARRDEGAARGSFVAKVVKPDRSTEDRIVTIGVANRVAAEVKSGLAVGEQVVLPTTAGPSRPGQQQRPMRTPRLS
jgi:macrolide-specific efflux system membrane fusion protein